jgi:hypothetical protein
VADSKTVVKGTSSAPKEGMPLSPRMLVDIPTRKNGIDEYFFRLDSEQDSPVANANLAFRPPVDEMIGSFDGVLVSIT